MTERTVADGPLAPRPAGPRIGSAAGRAYTVAGCSGESLLLAEAVMRAGERLNAMTFTGIFVPGLNTCTYLANPKCRVETFFLTPELKASGSAVRFLPLCYGDILARLRSVPIDAALFMTTPPDAGGSCGFGPVVDFLAELWPRNPGPHRAYQSSSANRRRSVPDSAWCTNGLCRGGAGLARLRERRRQFPVAGDRRECREVR